ncbi:hypothetical protein DV515_00010247 [Chloebia gouldiae]|uniref:Nucleolus and neural progenitor protein-like N-terminal domain-containing protein n=1 Tax=Chloebia gouldiae TaxID=44316 RepID=A0A3L8SBB9_CHLGU|nr:hypothetical protein DV515_00010247 [Chloebia gouldiae]
MVPPTLGLAARSGKMAAPRAAWDGRDVPWNRLDVLWPANSARVPLAAQHPAGPGAMPRGWGVFEAVPECFGWVVGRWEPEEWPERRRAPRRCSVPVLGAVRLLSALRRRCDIAGKRLSGPGPAAEGRVLRAVLYVYHSRLLRHRPYLALQQVSTNPAWAATTRQLGTPAPRKSLWSSTWCSEHRAKKKVWEQVEQCLKRLWKMNLVGCLETLVELIPKIQYRCVLQTLMSLYSALSTMLHLVSETQQTPYIKGFTFPSDISDFLGVNLSSEAKKQKTKMLTTKKSTSWMKKFFPAMPEAISKVGKKRKSVTCTSAMKDRSILCPMDIGETVVVPTARRGKHPGFDVKSLLRSSRHPAQEGLSITSTPFKAKSLRLSSQIAKSQHAGSLVQMVQTAASFGELSEALRKAILWCKNNKLKPEAYFLRNKLLKSNRLHHVEAHGCSLKKKLRCVKTSVRKYLLYGSQHMRWPRQHLRAWLCRRRIRSSALLKTAPKTGGQKSPELFGVCENSASLILPAYQDGSPSQEEHSSIDTGYARLSTMGTSKRLLLEGGPGLVWKEAAENTDIDSIFAAIGCKALHSDRAADFGHSYV